MEETHTEIFPHIYHHKLKTSSYSESVQFENILRKNEFHDVRL